jgi:hypothetical protein
MGTGLWGELRILRRYHWEQNIRELGVYYILNDGFTMENFRLNMTIILNILVLLRVGT